MDLARFIETHYDEIVVEWVKYAETLVPGKKMDLEELRDHARPILTEIVANMNAFQSLDEQQQKSRGHGIPGALSHIGNIHATARLRSGFKLEDLIGEYRALRASVLRLWERNKKDDDDDDDDDGGDVKDTIRFNEAVDEALVEATSHFYKVIEEYTNQFIGILGHDLKNPLNAILMTAKTIKQRNHLDDITFRSVARISSSAERMQRLIADLLDLTRGRLGGGLPIFKKNLDLKHICEQAIIEAESSHPDRKIICSAKDELYGFFDGERMTQALSNLLGNAIEYSAPNTRIEISITQTETSFLITVHNFGTPIPHDMMERIFDPMTRATKSDRRGGSLGLGLYIVRQVMQAHGGSVSVTSAQREGTTFTLMLPKR